MSLSPNVIFFTAYNPTLSTHDWLEIRKTEDEKADFMRLKHFSFAHTLIHNALEQPLEHLPPWLWKLR